MMLPFWILHFSCACGFSMLFSEPVTESFSHSLECFMPCVALTLFVQWILNEFSAYTNMSWPDESFANVHHKVPMHPMKAKFKAAQHNRMEQTLLALFQWNTSYIRCQCKWP